MAHRPPDTPWSRRPPPAERHHQRRQQPDEPVRAAARARAATAAAGKTAHIGAVEIAALVAVCAIGLAVAARLDADVVLQIAQVGPTVAVLDALIALG